jgi:hypothetical protein
MSYLSTGTTYPNAVTNFLPGILNNGDDFAATVVNTTGASGPLVALSTAVTGTVITTSKVFHELTGVTGLVYVIAAIPSGNSLGGTEASKTPALVKFYDVAGGVAANNVTVSGQAGVLINGAATKVLNTAYGVATFTNITGNTWIAS